MNIEKIQGYFTADSIVDHYAQAATKIGLWLSEEKIFARVFDHNASLLELGCGAGRIAFGLHELGYAHILAVDYSKQMIEKARHLAKLLEYSVPFHVGNATNLRFEDAIFDGVIFGFNGLMQIPQQALRERALCEVFRVVRPGGWFVFTTHDRDHSQHPDFWQEEQQRWQAGEQSEALEMFGDRTESFAEGIHFMHVPTIQEMEAVLKKVGFRIEVSLMRSEIVDEPKEVTDFSDECRFWIVQKPEFSASQYD